MSIGMRHDPHLYILCGIEEIEKFMEGAYLDKDYNLKIPDLPWPDDYFKREEELSDKVFTVGFDDWSIEFRASKLKQEKDKADRMKAKTDKVKRIRNRQLFRLITYLYCKNILFQMAFLFYQYENDLAYQAPHKAYFRILTIIFLTNWSCVEH